MRVAIAIVLIAASAHAQPKGAWQLAQHRTAADVWLPMELSGSTVADRTSNGNDATAYNTPTSVTGKFGNAINFASASSQYLQVADSSSLSNTVITVAVWIKPTSVALYWLLDKFSSVSSVYLPTTEAGFYDGTAWRTAPFATAITTSWLHMAYTYDGTTIKTYYNGQSDGSFNHSASLPQTSAVLDIARRFNATYYFNGIMEDVRIYGVALSDKEVRAIYNMGR